MKSATSSTGSAAWCLTFDTLRADGSTLSRLPFQRAGFSPSRYFLVIAQSNTHSIRFRTRVAVSVLTPQSGWITARMWEMSMSFTNMPPITG